jgi:serine/threonine protein kinase
MPAGGAGRPVAEVALQLAERGRRPRHGIIHRDLKPTNIIQGRPRQILDFGLANSASTRLRSETPPNCPPEASPEGTVVGTMAYMRPSSCAGPTSIRPTSSLGVLYEMVTGVHPFACGSRMDMAAPSSTRCRRS